MKKFYSKVLFLQQQGKVCIKPLQRPLGFDVLPLSLPHVPLLVIISAIFFFSKGLNFSRSRFLATDGVSTVCLTAPYYAVLHTAYSVGNFLMLCVL
jgi:hypothetical protein